MNEEFETKQTDTKRRRLLLALVSIAGAAGVVVASWPFIRSLMPSQKARALGAPVQFDLRQLRPGKQATVKWQGRPIWVLKRDKEMLRNLSKQTLLEQLRDPESLELTQQPDYARNATRSIKPEYLVTTAICTHLGCVPAFRPDIAPDDIGKNWIGGYFCPCHKSKFDLAGRVFKGVPAPTNLAIPPYRYIDDQTIEIGVDDEKV